MTIFTEGYVFSDGSAQPASVSIWSYPIQGGNAIFSNLNEDLRITLHTNFSHFKTCKPHIYDSEIYVYCSSYSSISADLDLGNNISSIYIEQNQDILINWDIFGNLKSYFIPHVNSTSNSWNSDLRLSYSADDAADFQFFEDSIFLLVNGFSTDELNFPNGSISCYFTGTCSILVRLDLNGTVDEYITFSKYYSHLGRHEMVDPQGFSILNSSAIQTKIRSSASVVLKNSSGDTISYSGDLIYTDTGHIGFDTNLNYIRAISDSVCPGLEMYSVAILPERTYYVTKGGNDNRCNSERYNWMSSNITSFIQDWRTFGSKMPNGTLEWSYSWHELDGYHDKYSILPFLTE